MGYKYQKWRSMYGKNDGTKYLTSQISEELSWGVAEHSTTMSHTARRRRFIGNRWD